MRCVSRLLLLLLVSVTGISLLAQEDYDNKLALARIEEARQTQAVELHLGGPDLTGLPPELFTLTHLKKLSIGYSDLTALPPEIGRMTNLEWIYISGRLQTLPPEIGNLSNLRYLNVG